MRERRFTHGFGIGFDAAFVLLVLNTMLLIAVVAAIVLPAIRHAWLWLFPF